MDDASLPSAGVSSMCDCSACRSPIQEIVFSIRSIMPLILGLFLLVLFILRRPLPSVSFKPPSDVPSPHPKDPASDSQVAADSHKRSSHILPETGEDAGAIYVVSVDASTAFDNTPFAFDGSAVAAATPSPGGPTAEGGQEGLDEAALPSQPVAMGAKEAAAAAAVDATAAPPDVQDWAEGEQQTFRFRRPSASGSGRLHRRSQNGGNSVVEGAPPSATAPVPIATIISIAVMPAQRPDTAPRQPRRVRSMLSMLCAQVSKHTNLLVAVFLCQMGMICFNVGECESTQGLLSPSSVQQPTFLRCCSPTTTIACLPIQARTENYPRPVAHV